MNKIVLGIAAVVALGGLAYFLMNSSGAETPNTQGARGSIASLRTMSPSRCEVTHAEQGVSSTGVVFVANGKMRGDFSSTLNGQSVESHMISDGEFVYTWSSAMPQGVKIAVSATENSTGTGYQQGNVYNQNVDYNCTPWSADQSQFQLPSGVTFTDLSAMMPGANAQGSGSVQTGGMNCAMCDQAPEGAAREQCRAAMKCN